MIPRQVVTHPRVNWIIDCARCGAAIVAAQPGDAVRSAERQGWKFGHCRGCRRKAGAP